MNDFWDEESAGGKVPRDRWKRPLIVKGGKVIPYTRVTTFASSVEDYYALGNWEKRMVAIGLVERPDLLLSVAAHRDDKQELDQIAEAAKEAAKASAAANTGTALHKLAERYDRQQIGLADVPESNRADLAAYAEKMAPLTIHGIEEFVVLDSLQVAGTFDRIVEYDGQRYVADVKTGSIDYPGKMAIQLALYSRGLLYEHGKVDTRKPTGVSQNAGIIIHLPAGQGRCDLYWIDLTAGWEAVELCGHVRTWRKRKNLLAAASFGTAILDPPVSEVDQAIAAVTDEFPHAVIFERVTDLNELIPLARSVAELEELWAANQDTWTAEHTRAAAARKNQLHHKVLKDAISA